MGRCPTGSPGKAKGVQVRQVRGTAVPGAQTLIIRVPCKHDGAGAIGTSQIVSEETKMKEKIPCGLVLLRMGPAVFRVWAMLRVGGILSSPFLIQSSTPGVFPRHHLAFKITPVRLVRKLCIQIHCGQLAEFRLAFLCVRASW